MAERKGGTMEDRQIVELYWQRNESAIDETEKKYKSYLSKIAYNVLSDYEDAKESVNDTYLAAWESIPPHRPTRLSTYLGKLVRRISIDLFRKKNRDKRRDSQFSLSLSELSEVISKDPQPSELLEAELLSKKLSAFLQDLRPEARHAFIGRYYFLDSVKDIARYCNMTEAKTKTILHRTRLSLKEYLEKEGFMI